MGSGITITAGTATSTTAPERARQHNSNPVERTPRRPLPQYRKTMEKLNALQTEIEALKGQLSTASLSDSERTRVEFQLNQLQAVSKQRDEMADVQISRDGKTVVFTLKDYYTAETVKKAFGIKDGAFRAAIAEEALAESGADGTSSYSSFEAAKKDGVTRFANGVYIEKNWFGVDKVNYSRAILQSGRQYTVKAEDLK